jgi:hypothetical protein
MKLPILQLSPLYCMYIVLYTTCNLLCMSIGNLVLAVDWIERFLIAVLVLALFFSPSFTVRFLVHITPIQQTILPHTHTRARAHAHTDQVWSDWYLGVRWFDFRSGVPSEILLLFPKVA